MTPEQRAIKKFMERDEEPQSYACACLGAQNNEPACYCAMAWVVTIDENYYRIGKERTEWGYNYTATLIGSIHTDYGAERMRQWEEARQTREQSFSPATLQERLAKFKEKKARGDKLINKKPSGAVYGFTQITHDLGLDEEPIGSMMLR